MNRNALITGGAGFIGGNLARHLLAESARVTLLDNFSRTGVEHNVEMLRRIGGDLTVIEGDVRDRDRLASLVRSADEVYHLAAQVAVTTSVVDPRQDFENNLVGTFNLLEAIRMAAHHPFVLFTSTNKVYGDLAYLPLNESASRYSFCDREGVNEEQPLDFHSPYGCSKGASDQYVRDYARIYGIPAVVFRMSCIAGPQQFGNEDQGWLAHFLYSVLAERPITIFGDGRQVRDILNVGDLVEAMSLARTHLKRTAGEIYNIGGGAKNAASLLEVLNLLAALTGKKPQISFESPRVGDQKIFITDHRKFTHTTGWSPRHSLHDTVAHMMAWWAQNRTLLEEVAPALRGVPLGEVRLAS
jgi:CDP-paratose 2-epimerase